MSPEALLHPKHVPHPELNLLFSLLCSFLISIFGKISVQFGSQTNRVSQFVLCIMVTVNERVLKVCLCMFLQILHFLQGHKNADASLLVKNMSAMRSRHIFAKIQSSMPIAAALP